MKISIITPVFNAFESIEDTIKSVIKEKVNHNIEYVVIDGGSTDGTLTILEKYKKYIDILVSENDNGLYDALNKGIKMSSGDYIIMLAADDFLLNNAINSFLSSVHATTDVWCGSIVTFSDNEYNFLYSESNVNNLYRRCSLRNPATFFKRSIFEKFGYYNTKYRISADREFFLRLFKNNVVFQIERFPIVFFSMNGVSNIDTRTTKEDYDISIEYGMNVVFAYLIYLFSSRWFVNYLKKPARKIVNLILGDKVFYHYFNKTSKIDPDLIISLGLKKSNRL